MPSRYTITLDEAFVSHAAARRCSFETFKHTLTNQGADVNKHIGQRVNEGAGLTMQELVEPLPSLFDDIDRSFAQRRDTLDKTVDV